MNNIERFEELARMTEKDNIENLIQYCRNSDFYTAWASSSYHLNMDGGLLQHSLNVCDYAIRLWKSFNSSVNLQSLMFCSLFHDLGKSGLAGDEYYVPNTLKSGNISGTKPIKINPKLRIKNHAMRLNCHTRCIYVSCVCGIYRSTRIRKRRHLLERIF